jgi:hypothetical protein
LLIKRLFRRECNIDKFHDLKGFYPLKQGKDRKKEG